MSTSGNRNLVVTRAGPASLHSLWVSSPEARNFDLLVAAYDKRAMGDAAAGVDYLYIPGPKVAGWSRLFSERQDLLSRYDRIALIDDDIAADAGGLSRCFDIGRALRLKAWQPSLSWESHVSHGATLRNPRFSLRYVNFIEMMCPFLETSFLRETLPLFALNLESGLDLVWCSIPNERRRSFAIIDEVAVTHTRPVGANKSANGFVGREYQSDIYRCLDLFDAKWLSCVAYEALLPDGNTVVPQFLVSISALGLSPAVFAAPEGERIDRLKMLARHIRQQFTRKSAYIESAAATLRNLFPDAPGNAGSPALQNS